MTLPTIQPDSGDQQVFRPVPTDDDMRALSHQVRRARQGQARLLAAAIFLAGIIVAGIMAAGLVLGNSDDRLAAAGERIEALSAELRKGEAALAEREARIAALEAELAGFAAFRSLQLLEQQGEALEAIIASLLSQPSRAGAPRRLTQLPPPVSWMDAGVLALRTRRDALEALKAEIEAWPPPAPSPRPD
jgi:hypothetical protein